MESNEAVENELSGVKNEIDKLNTHIKTAEDWVRRRYNTSDELGKVNDLMLEAGRLFDEWGLGQNSNMDIDTMVDALSFVQTHRNKYFED